MKDIMLLENPQKLKFAIFHCLLTGSDKFPGLLSSKQHSYLDHALLGPYIGF